MKEKFMRFMQGRYGVDQLSKALLVIGLNQCIAGFVFQGKSYWDNFLLCRMVPDHLLLFQDVLKECIKALCGESGISCKVVQDPLLFCKAERSVPAEKAVSYLQMPGMQSEDQDSKRQGKDRDPLSEVWHKVH